MPDKRLQPTLGNPSAAEAGRWAAPMTRVAVAALATLMTGSTHALDQSDAGTYAIVHVDGHVTEIVFRIAHPNVSWKVENRQPDGSWEDVACEEGCITMESSPADVERFLGKAPQGMNAECINNTAFAICRVIDDAKPEERQYLFVALTEAQPITLRLVRSP